MKAPNAAQTLLMMLGVEPQVVLLSHLKEKSRSHTKKGLGRIHQQGKRKNQEVRT
jgi:phosphotransacetylase